MALAGYHVNIRLRERWLCGVSDILDEGQLIEAAVLSELVGSGKASDKLLKLYAPFLGFAVLAIFQGSVLGTPLPTLGRNTRVFYIETCFGKQQNPLIRHNLSLMNEIKDTSKEAYKYLMERNPHTWSRAFLTTDRACDAVENGISECFNSLIVEARRKPIINMLEDIRIFMMLRMKKMKDKQQLWEDEICPSIRKKVELIKDHFRKWEVIPSGGRMFEVRTPNIMFRVDEGKRTCSCRVRQLSGIPCGHGFAVIYHLHNNPDMYVSEWYKTSKFACAYNHYIYPLTSMDQWPPSDQIKPLPPIVRRMPGRPKHKRRRDITEGDGNRNRLSWVGRVMHCKNCHKGHNILTCNEPKIVGVSARGGGKKRGGVRTRGGVRIRGVNTGTENVNEVNATPMGNEEQTVVNGDPMIGNLNGSGFGFEQSAEIPLTASQPASPPASQPPTQAGSQTERIETGPRAPFKTPRKL